MNERKNIIVDSIKFGFKALYEHSFLFAMILISCIGVAYAVLFGFIYLNLVLVKANMPWLHVLFLLFSGISGIFLAIGLWLGFSKMALEIYDHSESSMSTLFSCMKLAPRALGAGIMYMIAVGIGSILFIIPGIFFAMHLFLFFYFIIDKNAGAFESLGMSLKATEKYGWQLFFLSIAIYFLTKFVLAFTSSLFISIESIATYWIFAITMFASIPFPVLVYAYFYRTVVSDTSAPELNNITMEKLKINLG